MAIAVRREGGFSGYFVDEITQADVTEPTVQECNDLRAREVMRLPPAPTYLRRRVRRYLLSFGVSLVASTLLLELVVRCVVGR
jgi:hypothetical protein